MRNLPKRDDTIYKEIESFEDYELTQCITYEMAIRNDGILFNLGNCIKLIELKMGDAIIYFTNNLEDLHEEKQRAEYLECGDVVEQIEGELMLCPLSGEWLENDLFYNPKTSMLFGDAKKVIQELVAEIKAM